VSKSLPEKTTPALGETLPIGVTTDRYLTAPESRHAPIHPREEQRIARLLGYDILDTESDVILDQLTAMAARITGSPIALISLIDRDRQWLKSHYGLDVEETSRDDAFCAHTIMDADQVMLITDSLKDARFVSNPFVTGEPHIRFYAGVPLHNGDKLAIGSLCVIDRKPKELSEEQINSLKSIARIVMDYIQVYRSNRHLTHLLLKEKQIYNRLLSMSSEMTSTSISLEDALQNILNHLDPSLGWLSCRINNLTIQRLPDIRMNPNLPKDPQLDLIWKEIDSQSPKVVRERKKTEFISSSVTGPEYAYLVVPVRNRGKLVARIEMIYPDHRKADSRIKEVFDIMAVNLGIIAERELATMELKYRANHDALTGAINRTLFLEELQKGISEANCNHPDAVLLFLDLDGFKEVNDNFGHQIGDRLLVEVTERLRSLSREKDILGRLSGDEFVLLVRHLDITEDLEPLLKRIQRHITQPFMLGDLEIRITSSIGAAILDRNDLTTPELLRRAEESMYLVKNGERKGYCIANKQIIKEFKDRLDLDHNIHEAVYEKRLLLQFQPIMDLRTGEICSAEALLRVLNKDGSIMNAHDFIPSLERSRLMTEVDDWVVAEAVRIVQQHLVKLPAIPGFRVSLNVSPAILMTHGYALFTLNRLMTANIPPGILRIEIIEDHLDTSNASLMENLNLLREAGVSIAIDDFGTGYSNLQHLSSIPFDTLKIDRAFLKGILPQNTKDKELLAGIVALGETLGYSLIAEGIEHQEQADYLVSIGCHHGQGYLYGKPMPIEGLIEFMVTHSPHVLDLSIPDTPSPPLLRHPQLSNH
jgi:diguanylate cyclase (GGDEF)-like protein